VEAFGAGNQDKGLISPAIGHNVVIITVCIWAVDSNPDRKGCGKRVKEHTTYLKTANLSVARMSSWVMPGLSAEWPAFSTITNSARGHTRLSSHAFAMGD
jgi:hypothetical protein